ncbi:transketolase [Acetohalobium arabaticum]|uniref:Transketolase subunit A n=1 Tax=Acetohalobium arabaticum (strain ATCC 49924 / DSM 5501 / Z-7288) TaxID=574087 RepID=D9QU39_ACEAZ|nr:transketolase [Acetohalobium arabaticum]ADL11832.1 transketolase subunit A [Acetohalobium arabaticum DSM 5501]
MTKIEDLEDKTTELRRSILKMVAKAGSGHPGGSLSAAEIVTALYFEEMNLDPANPDWEDRDRFVLSKGHAAPVLYAALAKKGYFPEEELQTLRDLDSHLQGHPDMNKTPGVDMTAGSLGQGLSAAVGMALAGKLDQKDYRVFAMVGDGEIQEGQIWEAAMSAANYKLDNLIAFTDYNQVQLIDKTEKVMNVHSVTDKFEAFGWYTIEIDGHELTEILEALAEAREVTDKPVMIVANTVKGKGVSFMEDKAAWHGNAPDEEELEQALAELN